MRREEVAAVMSQREGGIMGATQTKEEKIFEVWRGSEEQIRKEVSEPVEGQLK